MCQCNGETIDHFYIHCDVVCDLWSLSFRTFGIGVIEEGGEPFVQVEELVWEALFRDLECGTVMSDVDIVEGEINAPFEDSKKKKESVGGVAN